MSPLLLCQVLFQVFHVEFNPQITPYRRMEGAIIIIISPILWMKISSEGEGNS